MVDLYKLFVKCCGNNQKTPNNLPKKYSFFFIEMDYNKGIYERRGNGV